MTRRRRDFAWTGWTFAAVIVAWMSNVASRQIRTTWAATHDMARAGESVSTAWRHPAPSFNRTDLLAAGAAIVILLLIWVYQYGGRKQTRPGEEQGSAAWAKPSDMIPYSNKNKGENLLMTKTEALNLDTHATRRNLNVLVTGASGAGKTRGYVLPNLTNLARHHTPISLCVTDPKGEIFTATAAPMRQAGWRVKTFNLIDMASSDHFNPLRYVNPDDPEGSIIRLADNILSNTTKENRNGSNGDFWDKAAKSLLTALIAFTWFVEEEKDRNLNTVIHMLLDMQASENDENAMSPTDVLFHDASQKVEDYHLFPDQYDQATGAALDGLAFACSQYRTYEQGAGETKKSIITTLSNNLAGLMTHRIQEILSDDTMHLEAVGEQPTIIYIIISDTNATFTYLAALFYQCLFETTIYQADHTPGGALDVPLHCMLDEFANIGRIPGFPTLISTMRSRSISVSIILQTIAQIKSLYKDNWETITANCDSKLFLGGNDLATTEWWSKMLGNQTIYITSTSQNNGSNGNWGRQQNSQKRELLAPDELGRLPNDQCIYLLRGLRPFLSQKLR
ncbi:VirD4-like conjugal transfer protein, CD1115 family [Parascardovia denticolens]|uniref:VirD4-like conjugal transfer protein, CD1115 family n=1 Tax=Parascardovia denticolens TaxID=78258 RepID=UPI00248F0F7C|nr:type IV secretory system conjugative DNA transfer family protein [Parascardovia denticolens]